MSTNVPVTIWRPQNGDAEMSASNSAFIDTESGLDIITESGLNLIIEPGTSTPKPATVWAENDAA